MRFIFFIAAFNALLYAVLLLQKKNKALHDHILTVWLIFLGIYTGTYAIYSHELFVHFKLLSLSMLSLLMLPGPFLYIYVLSLVTGKKKILPQDLIHLIPVILFNLYIFIESFDPNAYSQLNIEKLDRFYSPPAAFIFFLLLTAFSGPFYFMLTLRLFKKHDIQIFNNFSNSSGLDLLWMRRLIFVFAFAWTSLIITTIIHHVFHLFPMEFCIDGLFLSLSVFLIIIGYFGLKQKIIFEPELPVLQEKSIEKYKNLKLNNSELDNLSEKIEKHIASAKSYLDPDLTLSKLSTETGIAPHVLSRIINEKFEMNFFDFINEYRIKEVTKRMADPAWAKYSILGIAYETGFNSKSAFNRVFKKTTGQTPSEMRKTKLNQSSLA